jgi:hypothetical protein
MSFDRYQQPKRAFSGGFTTTLHLGTGATTQTAIAVKQTTPLYAPKKHTIHVQRVTLVVTTGAAHTLQLRSGTTHTVITPAMDLTTAGTKYEYDFGPQGVAIETNENLEALISAAGAAVSLTIEGFQERTATDLAGSFTLSSASGDVHDAHAITLTAGAGTFFFAGSPSVTVGGVAATSVVRVSSSSITCSFPATGHLGTGLKDVVLTQADGSVITQAGAYTWTESAYVLTSVTANTGLAAGGQARTLAGYYFGAGVVVTFGGVAATGVVPAAGGLSCAVITPAHAAGAVNVVFTNLDGTTATAVGGFTYS